jgi:cytochrome c biogenesis protein
VTAVDERAPASAPPPPPRHQNRLLVSLRNAWRQLTSMRTALVLLFLLAIAAIPGSLLPQRGVNSERVAQYAQAHPDLAPVLDRLGFFEVYASPWFSAIYLLLFTSLIGCVVPRLAEHVRALRSVPPDAPQRLDRLPRHAAATETRADAATAAAAIARSLRGFRTRVREHPDGSWTVGAEKGYAKETGNLLFHAALLAVLVGVGFGSWYGWHGNRLLVAGADKAFCDTLQQYDESALGARVQPADLPRFCLQLDDFEATWQPSGQPKSFRASVSVDTGGAVARRTFSVNDPLRLDGASVYLLGNGYAPVLRFTDRYGQQLTRVVPFLPNDAMLTSEGVALFADVNVDPRTNRQDRDAQWAFEGLYMPTVRDTPPFTTSQFPAERNPAVMLFAYRGDLGLDVGNPGNVYQLPRAQIDRGKLKAVGEGRLLRRGETWRLDDGSSVEFVGTRRWITISVRSNPAQPLVLGGAVTGLAGLMLSLGGRRRRVFFRVTPSGPGGAGTGDGVSLIEAGGLPRIDYPGFADEFDRLVAAARSERRD